MSSRIPRWSDVHDKGASPRALALRDWLIEPHQRLGAQWEEQFVAGMVELLASATLDDCVYAGFEFDPVRKALRGKTIWDRGYWASIEFSADDASTARHRAVCFIRMDEYGTRVWIDGAALPVPCDDGVPLAEPHVGEVANGAPARVIPLDK